MGVIDQKLFTDAVSQAKAAGPSLVSSEWVAAFHACNRLAMFDMLPALEAINLTDRGWLIALGSQKNLGQGAVNRFIFAKEVIDSREIEDLGLPEEQVNDGREFLGCTRLDDSGVQQIINHALTTAGVWRCS